MTSLIRRNKVKDFDQWKKQRLRLALFFVPSLLETAPLPSVQRHRLVRLARFVLTHCRLPRCTLTSTRRAVADSGTWRHEVHTAEELLDELQPNLSIGCRPAFERSRTKVAARQHRPLLAMVPAPRFHTVRYSGVLSSASTWRSLVIPPPPLAPDVPPAIAPVADGKRPKAGKRSRYWRWADLLRRTFGLDPLSCDRCGGKMELVALVTDPDSIARYLRHIGEPTEPPSLGPARGPPYYQTRVLRRCSSPPQQDLFDA